ncbi:aminotransferase class I/II-fold pyridoxal phosphate-dependent enzyme [Niveispirillum sp. SYP-B3756]|uniref:aminotransferase class I/II-fold pyridoxal phosphate-dependent enzyme n=1 Tax=Niveispirillum sp. SYP-B3756 TaxID=2662178 RepID=UPI0012909AC9|nr:8-amino-7-oxononanoate synthase [Niveispirillum sp. SYP-B3756]MQP67192.1 aminotransferase class I/II-fold pyridoxal phosphate-dependent enzyme [Niveispirillum sp. SYP-B3756]
MNGLLDERAASALAGLSAASRRRSLRPLVRDGIRLQLPDGRWLIDAASNDYLGLAHDPRVAARAADYATRYGAGSAASRLVAGTLAIHREVEEKLAAFLGVEAALLLGTGFQANATLLPALAELLGPGTELLVDRLAHASLIQGSFAAGLKAKRFRHNDLGHLESLLRERANAAPPLVVTESVFSMDGDRCDLPALLDLCERFGAPLYLDEAHAVGVLGPGGRGLAAGVPGRVSINMGTFGKAFGGFGAYVAGSRQLIDYLINRCAGFIYTTALPPAVLGALEAALDLLPALDGARARLADMGERVRAAVRAAGYDVLDSSTQIIPLVAGPDATALELAAKLEQAGYLVVAIRPPTVPPGTARLRLSLSSALSAADIAGLLAAIAALPRGPLE